MFNQLFEFKNIDFTSEPLFLGSGRNIARNDLNIQQGIQKITDDAMGKMWFKGDFPYSKDRKDYISFSPELRLLFLTNLKFQTTADSIAGRVVAEALAPITTNPQLETYWAIHQFFETAIHSPTYAEIIKAMPDDAKEIFDGIILDENIVGRFKDILVEFEDTVERNAIRMLVAKGVLDKSMYDEDAHKKSLVRSLYALNILESIKFKSSFITSFAFKENGLMSNSVDGIQKIQIDEIGHYGMTVNLINTMKKDPRYQFAFAEQEEYIVGMYKTALQVDKEYIKHLFASGAKLMGLNEQILTQYAEYNIHGVMRSIGLPHIVEKTFNPCIWANSYAKTGAVQSAQKEKVSGNYLLGITDTSTAEEFWSSLA